MIRDGVESISQYNSTDATLSQCLSHREGGPMRPHLAHGGCVPTGGGQIHDHDLTRPEFYTAPMFPSIVFCAGGSCKSHPKSPIASSTLLLKSGTVDPWLVGHLRFLLHFQLLLRIFFLLLLLRYPQYFLNISSFLSARRDF